MAFDPLSARNPGLAARELRALEAAIASPYDDHVEVLGIFNKGHHYRLKVRERVVDYWPASGRWCEHPATVKGKKRPLAHNGLRGLLVWAARHEPRRD